MNYFCSQAYTQNGLTYIRNQTAKSDNFTYIFKGYPNSLKAELLRKLQNSAGCECLMEYDYNESPVSLMCAGRGFSVVDGTAPNCAEPLTYGITDALIDLNAYQNQEELRNRKDEILSLFREIKKEEHRCAGFISAARGIAEDCRRIEMPSLNKPKINRFSARLWKTYGTPPTGKIGREKKYFANVLTSDGCSFPFSAFSDLCERISVINDFSMSAASIITDKIRLYALSSGHDVISFLDFLDGKTVRHIIIPEISYGIYCEKTSSVTFENAKRIRKTRFIKEDFADNFKPRSNFCKKAYNELIAESVKTLKSVDYLKNKLDNVYLSVTNEKNISYEIVKKCLP
ncbi:MAG: hypothetical protein MJ120_03600 [Clostridia bacterium]|nr:hypothetical protein [Clostridia bacterium]